MELRVEMGNMGWGGHPVLRVNPVQTEAHPLRGVMGKTERMESRSPLTERLGERVETVLAQMVLLVLTERRVRRAMMGVMAKTEVTVAMGVPPISYFLRARPVR